MSLLTAGQERLWFLHRLDPADASYNMPVALRLRGPLDAELLTRSLAALAVRHDMLRSRFTERDGVPVREVDELPPPLERLDVRPEMAPAVVAELANRPFALSEGPVVRFALLRLGPEEHVLCLVMHHIVADGWSVEVLLGELADLFDGALLSPLPITFAAHAERTRAEDTSWSAAYWTAELAGLNPLELPFDRPKPATGSHRGGQVHRPLHRGVMDGVMALARSARVTPFMVLLAAFQALLARHSPERDVCVASPVLGRDHLDTERLVGYFTGLIMLRADVSADPAFADLLAQTRERALRAYDHGEVPFGTPFQAMFMYMRTSTERPRLGGLHVEIFDSGLAGSKTDLALDVYQGPSETGATFTYDADLFDRDTAQALADRYVTLLADVVSRPAARVSELALGLPTPPPYLQSEPETTVPELFAEQVASAPDLVAVICGDERVTYAELDRRATGLAPMRGRVVRVDAVRSVDTLATLLAVWRAGAAYLPLDPAYPAAHLASLVADSEAIEPVAGRTPERGPEPSEAAYVIYTSGSSGPPKGVVVEHRSLAARVRWMREAYELRPGDRIVQFAALSFDAHAEEIFPALCSGATVVLLPEGATSLPDFLDTDEGAKVTVLDLPTAYWHRLVADGVSWPPALRLVILGGEQVSGAAVRAWRDRFGDRVRLVNTYGPTETTVIATAADLTGADDLPPIGVPVGETSAYILDRHGGLTPDGVPGELVVGGAGVARGYLGRPEQTAERFRPCPYGHGRVYHTGDRVRRRRDGQLEFLGRFDQQVKVRGFRVEPEEIETAIAALPGVDQAAVLARDGELVAYVSGRAALDDLRRALVERLPDHLVPGHWVSVAAFPLTPNGKLDRGALPAPEAGHAVHVPPRTDAEHLVADIWARVLGLDRVGADDDFFALGGHSLLATRVVARVREAADLAVPVREVFRRRTLAEFAAEVDRLAELAENAERTWVST